MAEVCWSGLGVLSVEGGVAPVFVFYANSGHDPHELEGFGHRTSKEKNNLLISFI